MLVGGLMRGVHRDRWVCSAVDRGLPEPPAASAGPPAAHRSGWSPTIALVLNAVLLLLLIED